MICKRLRISVLGGVDRGIVEFIVNGSTAALSWLRKQGEIASLSLAMTETMARLQKNYVFVVARSAAKRQSKTIALIARRANLFIGEYAS